MFYRLVQFFCFPIDLLFCFSQKALLFPAKGSNSLIIKLLVTDAAGQLIYFFQGREKRGSLVDLVLLIKCRKSP